MRHKRGLWPDGLFGLVLLLFAAWAQAQLNPGCSATTPSNATFSSTSSLSAFSAQQTTSTTNAGLSCGGPLLTVLNSNTRIDATVMSSNAAGTTPRLFNGSDYVTYQIYADPARTRPIASGQTVHYADSTLISVLGLNNPAAYMPLPMYFAIPAGVLNLSAGTYTDTISILWNWSVCSVAQAGTMCLGTLSSGTATRSFTVSVTITNDCKVTASDIAFGAAPLVSSFVPVGGAVSITCTRNSPYTVGLSDGSAPLAGQRRMVNGSYYLSYEIYQGTSGTLRWGSGSGQRYAGTGSGLAQSASYRAVILTQPTPPAGTYTDMVVLEVAF